MRREGEIKGHVAGWWAGPPPSFQFIPFFIPFLFLSSSMLLYCCFLD
jgi:hypothetical protein